MRLSVHTRFHEQGLEHFKKFYQSNKETFRTTHEDPLDKSSKEHLETSDGYVVYLEEIPEEDREKFGDNRYYVRVATPQEFSRLHKKLLIKSRQLLFELGEIDNLDEDALPKKTDVHKRTVHPKKPTHTHSRHSPPTSGYSSKGFTPQSSLEDDFPPYSPLQNDDLFSEEEGDDEDLPLLPSPIGKKKPLTLSDLAKSSSESEDELLDTSYHPAPNRKKQRTKRQSKPLLSRSDSEESISSIGLTQEPPEITPITPIKRPMVRKTAKVPPPTISSPTTSSPLPQRTVDTLPPEKSPERREQRKTDTAATLVFSTSYQEVAPDVAKARQAAQDMLQRECNIFLEAQHCKTPEEEQAARVVFYGALVDPTRGVMWPKNDYGEPDFEKINVDMETLVPNTALNGVSSLIALAKHRMAEHRRFMDSDQSSFLDVRKQKVAQEAVRIMRFCRQNNIAAADIALWKRPKLKSGSALHDEARYQHLIFGRNIYLASSGRQPQDDSEAALKLKEDMAAVQWLSQELQKRTSSKKGPARFTPRHVNIYDDIAPDRPGKKIFTALLDDYRKTNSSAPFDHSTEETLLDSPQATALIEDDIIRFQEYCRRLNHQRLASQLPPSNPSGSTAFIIDLETEEIQDYQSNQHLPFMRSNSGNFSGSDEEDN